MATVVEVLTETGTMNDLVSRRFNNSETIVSGTANEVMPEADGRRSALAFVSGTCHEASPAVNKKSTGGRVSVAPSIANGGALLVAAVLAATRGGWQHDIMLLTDVGYW